MNYILFDSAVREALKPFTFTRPVADIRIGILTIREKWEHYLKTTTSSKTESYLMDKFPMKTGDQNIFINGSCLPNETLVEQVKNLKPGEALSKNGELIACATGSATELPDLAAYNVLEIESEFMMLKHTWEIFSRNGEVLEADFELVTRGRKSAPISETNKVINPERIFLEEGARVEFSILNASNGPIYIGKDAEVMEGNMIRGGFALCHNGVVKMGAKIYGPSTVGPFGKVCGELSNSVIFGYSSKGHDGYLGNSVLGEWCNIGADSNNSNLKNNYAKVRLWNYATERFDQTGLQFCGLMMGDHSKTAINTMFNTGTVIGVNANIYVPGFPRNFVPSFSWGGASGFTAYLPKKAFEAAKVMMARRDVAFTEADAAILNHVYEITRKYRKY